MSENEKLLASHFFIDFRGFMNRMLKNYNNEFS